MRGEFPEAFERHFFESTRSQQRLCSLDEDQDVAHLERSFLEDGFWRAPGRTVLPRPAVPTTWLPRAYRNRVTNFRILYADDALVATLSPMAPPGFQARVAPGEAFTATFPASGDVSDGAAVCAGELRVLFRWLDTTTMEIGMTDAIVPDPTCE